MLLILIMITAISTTVYAESGTWHQDSRGWKYEYDEGGYAAGYWDFIDGWWYHFDGEGYLQTGWVWDDGDWYYVYPSFDIAAGWFWYEDQWYYMDNSGAMQTGWIQYGDDWYYMSLTGAMTVGWIYDQGNWYYLDPYTGSMVTGWLEYYYNWYYLDPSGAMVTGIQIIDEQPYYFSSGGVLLDLSNEEITPKQQYLINIALNMPSTPEGRCSEWIDNVLTSYGIDKETVRATRNTFYSYAYNNDLTTAEYAYDTDFNANDYWAYICTSEDLADLRPGMIVATRNSYSYMGRQFGHVGFYIGDGLIISSIGYISIMSIAEFEDEYNNKAAGSTMRWGFAPTMFR